MSKLIILTAPSGAGKTTIVKHLLTTFNDLSFSVSATTRAKRPYEVEGRDYYFVKPERFRELIDEGAFVEWEEVYDDMYYGTLQKEVERIWANGRHIVFDIDVKGALSIKRAYPEKSLAIFVKPPSMEVLEQRLRDRQTENEETFQKRWRRVKEEMSFADKFDEILINDKLEEALSRARELVRNFINQEA